MDVIAHPFSPMPVGQPVTRATCATAADHRSPSTPVPHPDTPATCVDPLTDVYRVDAIVHPSSPEPVDQPVCPPIILTTCVDPRANMCCSAIPHPSSPAPVDQPVSFRHFDDACRPLCHVPQCGCHSSPFLTCTCESACVFSRRCNDVIRPHANM